MDLKFDPANPKYEYITDNNAAEKALDALEKERMIAVDIESTSLDPYTGTLLLVQLGTPEIAYVFDARAVKLDKLPKYKALMENKTKIKLLQNASFDYKYLKVHTNVVLENVYDTMLAEGVLQAGRGQRLGLDSIVGRYFGEGMVSKDLQTSFADASPSVRISQDQLAYAAKDVLILFPIFEKQIKLLKKEDLLKVAKLEFVTAPVVAEMELKGVYIDTVKWREIMARLDTRSHELRQEFQDAVRPYYDTTQKDLFGGVADAVNINSSIQLMDLFNNKLHLNLPSTSEGILSRVNNPIVKLLRDYRGYSKLVSTYGESLLALINKKTGRIHPSFRQIATATGRFACTNPNIQNIPRNSKEVPLRECINPEPGYKLVVADYAQMEMRILCELSGDKNMLKIFQDNLDYHSYTASLMFDKPYSADFKKKYGEFRQMGKPVGFGLMYGMGAPGLVGRIFAVTGKEITIKESEDLINRYFKSYPSVKPFLDRMGKFAVKNGYSITPAGRKRWYKKPDATDPDYKKKIGSIGREGKNHPIQGTNADIIKYALVYTAARIKKEKVDCKITMTIHDEIVCEIREDQAEAWGPILSEEMVRAGELYLKTVPVASDPFVGDVWEH